MVKPIAASGRRFYTVIDSPLDPLLLLSDGDNLCGLYMDAQKYRPQQREDWKKDDGQFAQAKQQLRAYFAKELRSFSLPLAVSGTEFQRRVWSALLTIACGETKSYLDLAKQIKSPKAVRAVGLANGKNPISIIVPCHRVIGSNGKLTGYGGGLPRKQWLLEHEAPQKALFPA